MDQLKEIPKVEFDKKQDPSIEFEIITLKNLFSRSSGLNRLISQPHRVEFNHIFFITEGKGSHFIDFHQHSFCQGSLLFISKGQVHAFEVQPNRNGILILFTEAFLLKNLIHSDILSYYRLFNYDLQEPIIQPHETDAQFTNIVKEIYDEYHYSNDFAKEEILRFLLNLILLKVERIKHTVAPQIKNAEWLNQFSIFKKALESHFSETREAQDYAAMMKISYKFLNKICKSITGRTAKEFIDKFLIREVKRQIATSDISVKELTYQFGFDEPTNFVKYFKKHTSQSPAQFRKSLTI